MIIEINKPEEVPEALKQIKDHITEHLPVVVLIEEPDAVPEEEEPEEDDDTD